MILHLLESDQWFRRRYPETKTHGKNNYNISIIEIIFQNNKTEALLFVTLYTSIVMYIEDHILIRLDSLNSYI